LWNPKLVYKRILIKLYQTLSNTEIGIQLSPRYLPEIALGILKEMGEIDSAFMEIDFVSSPHPLDRSSHDQEKKMWVWWRKLYFSYIQFWRITFSLLFDKQSILEDWLSYWEVILPFLFFFISYYSNFVANISK